VKVMARAEVAPAALPHPRALLMPLSAGIFAGVAAFDVVPEALRLAGPRAAVWGLAGLAAFVAIHLGLGTTGGTHVSWAPTIALWVHSLLEGVVTATGYGVSVALGMVLSTAMAAHLLPEALALVAVLRRCGVTSRHALVRSALSWAMVGLGFVAAAFYLPLLPPPLLGAGMAVGGGGLAYLTIVTWVRRRAGVAECLAAALAGACCIGLLRLVP